jgi:molecular chaperone GrpE
MEAKNKEDSKEVKSENEMADESPLVGGTAKQDESKEITQELELIQNELLYLRAEFENYKKRILREQEQSIRFANEKIVRALLAVLDHLERGVSHGKELSGKGAVSENDFANFVNGIDMTHRELSQLLSRFGVEFIGAPGETFDPGKHEAISQQESSPDKENTILQVLQKGCLLHGRLLVPAKVVVAKSSKET